MAVNTINPCRFAAMFGPSLLHVSVRAFGCMARVHVARHTAADGLAYVKSVRT
jgi:hypothetical protein